MKRTPKQQLKYFFKRTLLYLVVFIGFSLFFAIWRLLGWGVGYELNPRPWSFEKVIDNLENILVLPGIITVMLILTLERKSKKEREAEDR